MDFGFGGNWRNSPRHNLRHQQQRNYSTMSQNRNFGDTCEKSTDVVYSPMGNVFNWSGMFCSTKPIASKKNAMEIPRSHIRSMNTHSQSFARPPRVDFYPVFVGVSNFISGFVSNFTGSAKEESNAIGANLTDGDSPPTVACTGRRDVDPDENITVDAIVGEKESAVGIAAAAADSGGMNVSARPGASADAALRCEHKVERLMALFSKDEKPTKLKIDHPVKVNSKPVDPEIGPSVITSCEDKLQKLKEMLSVKKSKLKSISSSVPICNKTQPVTSDSPSSSVASSLKDSLLKLKPPKKPQDDGMQIRSNKRRSKHKSEKGRKQLLMDIHEDLLGNEIVDESPRPCRALTQKKCKAPLKSILKLCATDKSRSKPNGDFDEVKGRFKNTSRSSGSDDSFVIVFQDPEEPATAKPRAVSECGSEDSFVVCFESEPNCFTNEVFTDEDSECHTDRSVCTSDSESDDERPTCLLGGSFSRTIGDLTDESLYSDSNSVSNFSVQKSNCAKSDGSDEIDCANAMPPKPVKKVHFTCEAPRVHVMCTWTFAYRAARMGHWERYVTDRERFKRRVADVDLALSWVLKPQHRARVLFQRIMPWRHAQRRLELAEAKKKKEEEERIRKEKEEEEERIKKLQEEEEERIKKLKEEEEEEERIKKLKEEEEERIKRQEEEREREEQNRETSGVVIVNSDFVNNNGNIRMDNTAVVPDSKDSLDNLDSVPGSVDIRANEVSTNITPVSYGCSMPNVCDSNVISAAVHVAENSITSQATECVNNKLLGKDECLHSNRNDVQTNIDSNVSLGNPREIEVLKNAYVKNNNLKTVNGINIDKSLALLNEMEKHAGDLTLNVCNSANTVLNELDRIAQQTIKYVDINVVNKNANGVTNCLISNGLSSSLQLIPLHNKMVDNSSKSHSEVAVNNLTLIR